VDRNGRGAQPGWASGLCWLIHLGRSGPIRWRHQDEIHVVTIRASPSTSSASFAERVARDAVLFLCVPGPLLVISAHLPLIKAWGFRPTAMGFVLVKLRPLADPTNFTLPRVPEVLQSSASSPRPRARQGALLRSQIGDAFFERRFDFAWITSDALDVAAGQKRRARACDQQRADAGVSAALHPPQGGREMIRERLARLRVVEHDQRDTVVDFAQQLASSGDDFRSELLPSRSLLLLFHRSRDREQSPK
jgi:hypothetical protein